MSLLYLKLKHTHTHSLSFSSAFFFSLLSISLSPSLSLSFTSFSHFSPSLFPDTHNNTISPSLFLTLLFSLCTISQSNMHTHTLSRSPPPILKHTHKDLHSLSLSLSFSHTHTHKDGEREIKWWSNGANTLVYITHISLSSVCVRVCVCVFLRWCWLFFLRAFTLTSKSV